MSTTIALTEWAHGAGCGCKIAPSILQEILATQTVAQPNANLLVGNESNDDAAVYLINEEQALIATTDFFTPIVDDAFLFGKIASANAISDVYAMGGTPILATAILGFPIDALPVTLAQAIIEGARATCLEANIPLAGGHSIDNKEPIFGLSVNGLLHPKNLKKNNTAQEGDVLFLTKPIGTGILSTAQKRKLIQPEEENIWINQLTRLNKIGTSLGGLTAVHAMTDVTGFGLLGHLFEMAEGSKLTAVINYGAIPILEASKYYASQNVVPDATYRNWNAYNQQVQFEPNVPVMEAFKILPDPQTNGGLLVSVSPNEISLVSKLLEKDNWFATPIGYMIQRQDKAIVVKE